MKKVGKQIGLGVVGVIIVAIIVAIVWLYAGKFTDTKAKAFRKLPLPVALVGNKTVSGQEFLKRVDLAENLYKDDPTFKSDEARPQILDQLTSDLKLRVVAEQHQVKTDSAAIDEEYKGIVDQYAGGDEKQFEDMLAHTYHLTPDEFKNNVLAADVLKTNLTVWFNGQKDLNKDAFDQEQKLLQMLDQGQAFEDVVKNYTQDEATKDFGGDLGSVKLSELAPEFRQPLSNVKAGDRVEVVSRYGLHIIKVVDIDRSGQEPTYHLQQLFVQETAFDDWFTKQTDAIKARKLIKL